MPRYTYTYKTIFVYWIERGTIQKMSVEIEIPDWKESNHPSFSSRVYSNQQKMELSERFREIFPIAPTFSSEDTVLHVDSPIFKEDKYGMWSYDDDIDKYRKLVSEVIQGEIDNAKNSLKKKENLLLSIA